MATAPSRPATWFLPARLASSSAQSDGGDDVLGHGSDVLGEAGHSEAHRDRPAVAEDRGLDLPADPLGVQQRAVLAGLHEQDRELVAAVPADHVDVARLPLQDIADDAERVVPRGVAQLGVDRLEAVDVEHHHGQRLVEAAVPGHLVLEPRREEAPVVQARDVVRERELLEPGIARFQLSAESVDPAGALVVGDRRTQDHEGAAEHEHHRDDGERATAEQAAGS